LLEANEVEIESLTARGPLDDLIVRVTLQDGPHLPPDEDRVRYYRLEYSSLTGWHFRRRVSALQYCLKLI